MSETLSQDAQALRFISAILNAKDAADTDASLVAEKVEAIIGFVRNSVCGTFRYTSNLSMEEMDQIQSHIWEWGNLQLKTWLKGKTVIAFVGEFSAGKTSLVNRILSQDSQDDTFKLPVSGEPTTAVATYISYGNETRVQFTGYSEDLKDLPAEVFMQFSKETLGKLPVARLIRYFVIQYNNRHLQNLSILDTPGFSSGDKEDERRTAEVIRETDALFWVIDVNAGEINGKSIQVIKEHMAHMPLYIIINKTDTKSPNERQEVLKQIQKTLQQNQVPVQDYLLCSKKEPIDALLKTISSIAAVKEEDTVVEDIRDFIRGLIAAYEKTIVKKRKEIRGYDAKREDAETVIGAFNEKRNRKIDKINLAANKMNELIGSTFFGAGDKITDTDAFWKQFYKRNDLFNELEELHKELANAHQDRIINLSQKIDPEKSLGEASAYKNDLKRTLETLDRLVSELYAAIK
jgi:small GTP-binding protein